MEPVKNLKRNKGILVAGFIMASSMYVLSQYVGSAQAVVASNAVLVTKSQPAFSVSSPSNKTAGSYADGTYTGSVADAYYGKVQVQATVTRGKLADVQFLQYPSSQSTSRSIDGRAMPILASEAIAAQSSSVDIVSGATFISQAFQQSLHSALAKA